MPRKASENIKTVLDILDDEVKGDADSAIKKLTQDYKMTWVYQAANGELFPSTRPDFASELKEAYQIQGRRYDIKNIAEGKDVVMVEIVESYPNPKTKKVYRTPFVIRHYRK